jgi:hypothetical protein
MFGPPLSPEPWPPPPLPTWLPGRPYSALFSNFVEEENMRNNKRDTTLLLVWHKSSYTERFLALLSCTCVLQPKLVHFYQTSLLLLDSLPIVASVSLRFLYLLLYGGHINHFQVLGFLTFPYSSYMHSPLTVWSMSNNITSFFVGL